MSTIGTVESLWRYPVKSMRGEMLPELFVGFGGVKGDRLYAFRSSAAPEDFPYFTARQQRQMLRYRPRISNGTVVVETPDGAIFEIDDPRLIDALREGVDPKHEVTLMHSERALADEFPVSIISRQTCAQLRDEIGTSLDPRQFRANIYVDLPERSGYGEEEFIGRSVRLGDEVILAIAKRDIRCVMINLDPETAEMSPQLLKQVGRAHGGAAGVYGTVVSEGTVRQGDAVGLVG